MKISSGVKKAMDQASTVSITSGLESFFVRLTTIVGSTEYTVGTATILYKEPQTKNTVLATSKSALKLFALYKGITVPTFNTKDTDFNSFVSKFNNEVNLIYGESLWAAPNTTPEIAPIAETRFKLGDNSWEYDLCLLVSSNQDLYDTKIRYSAWGDVSSWTSQANMPKDINGYYANADKNIALLFGFGDVELPYDSVTPKVPPVIKNSTYTFQYIDGNKATGPNPALINKSLQVCFAKIPAKSPLTSSNIYVWPWPGSQNGSSYQAMPAYTPLSIDSSFTYREKYIGATLLNTDDNSVGVRNDLGGGVFVNCKDELGADEQRFIGVISTINGTTETTGNFSQAFGELDPKNPFDCYISMLNYLPWPTRNQVVTLITPMLYNWPLTWPPVPTGWYTVNQQQQAKTYVEGLIKKATQANVSQALNDAFTPGRESTTPSNYMNMDIKHASAGNIGADSSATVFYQHETDADGKLVAVQLFALGSHAGSKSYTIDWVWSQYTAWYSAKYDEWKAALKGKNSNQAKPINAKFERMLGVQIVKGQTYNLKETVSPPS